MMRQALRRSALVPRGFDVESAVFDGTTTVITVRPANGRCYWSSRRCRVVALPQGAGL